MQALGLSHAELQFVGEHEVGDHSSQEIAEIDALLRDRGKPVSCLSRHVFAGTTSADRPGNESHTRHMDALNRGHPTGSGARRRGAQCSGEG